MKALGTWGPILIGASMVLYYGFISGYGRSGHGIDVWGASSMSTDQCVFLCTGILSIVAGLVALALTDRN